MKLVVGQNLLIEEARMLSIDFAWRSLTDNLNMEIGAFIFGENNQIISEKVDSNNLPLPKFISKDETGRHFKFDVINVPDDVKRIAFWALLPSSSKCFLKDSNYFQVKINHEKGKKVASIESDFKLEKARSAFLFEFYKHNDQWKISYKLQSFELNRLEALKYLNVPTVIIPTKKTSPVKKASPVNTVAPQEPLLEPLNESDSFATIELKKGENFSLSKQHSHCLSLVFKVNVVPKISDLELNVIAVGESQKLHNIKDFLYRENKELRGEGVKLNKNSVEIKLDQIPTDVVKLQLLVTRRSGGKRINSADFIELHLESSITGQSIAKFVVETSDKNYNTMVLLDLYLTKKGWSIRAIGQGFSDGLKKIGERYSFSPPKLRSIPKQESVVDTAPVAIGAIDNNDAINKQNKIQWIALGLMTLAGLFLIFKLKSFMLLPLIAVPAALGVYLYRQSNKKIKSIKDEEYERFVLNMIKTKHYQITAFEIAANHQMNVEQATTILEDLCDKGLGATALTEQGSIYYDFTRLKDVGEDKSNWS